MNRTRWIYLLEIFAFAYLALLSRWYPAYFSPFIGKFLGDFCAGFMAFGLIGMLFPKYSTGKVTLIAFILSQCIELSQLYHTPWLDAIRSTTIGWMMLGRGFVWSDLLCYTVGVAFAMLLELFLEPLNIFEWLKRPYRLNKV